MKKTPVKITDFLGVNNVRDPENAQQGELQSAINVDVTNDRKIKRRLGSDEVYGGANIHSLYSDGETMVFREGTNLQRMEDDNTATTIRSDFTGRHSMSYLSLNGRIYYTDRATTGVIQDKTSRSWGLSVPSAPTATNTAGALPDGGYQVALTYQRQDGQESGSLVSSMAVVTDGGVQVDNIPVSSDSSVEFVNIYMSSADGEVLYRAMQVSNGTKSATYRGDGSNFSTPLITQHLSPPPAGQLIAFYNGRIYIAQGSILWYTEPFNFELVSLAHNFFPLSSRITMIAPVDDGIWVGTDKTTSFIAGQDPAAGMRIATRATYGPIEGTSCVIDGEIVGDGQSFRGDAHIWASTRGFCVGGTGGVFANMTEGRYTLPDGASGAGIVRKQNGIDQYVVSINVNNNTASVTLPSITGDADGA